MMDMTKEKRTAAVPAVMAVLVVLLIVIGKSATTGYNRTFESRELTALHGQMSVESGQPGHRAGLYPAASGL